MARLTLTYGDLPTQDQFDKAWWESNPTTADGTPGFAFGNDPLVGTCVMSREELWEKLQWVWNEYADKLVGMGLTDDPEKQGSWLADMLSCLGIEWV